VSRAQGWEAAFWTGDPMRAPGMPLSQNRRSRVIWLLLALEVGKLAHPSRLDFSSPPQLTNCKRTKLIASNLRLPYVQIGPVCPSTASLLKVPERSTALHSIASPLALVAACTLPTCLGFWKTEYGVSYAYGGAMALSGLMQLGAPLHLLAYAHAACLVLYGVRLNLFLLYRELRLEKFRKFREKIESRSKEKGSRLKRTPFVLGCSFLYFGMIAPSVLVANASSTGADLAGNTFAARLFQCCLAAMYTGWALAASGDAYKSSIKARRGGSAIATAGPFYFLRHPNYTGEQLLWAANFVSGLAATAAVGSRTAWTSAAGWLVASALGVLGIFFVLMQATAGLEAKQQQAYGDDPVYEQWKARSWKGFARRILPSEKSEK